MKKNVKIIVLAAWAVLIVVLLGLGISRISVKEERYGQAEDIVAVTGTSASPEKVPSAREPETAVIRTATLESTDAPLKSTVSPRKTPGGPISEKTVSSTAKPASTEKPTPKPTEKPKPTSTAKPTPKPTEKPVYRFTIECRRILDRNDLWRDGLEEVIPRNGVFFSGTRDYVKGQTVYEALEEICEEQGILMDSRYTPIYETYYVSGIGNLYEFDCGAESGWKYSVNGVLPGVGCSRYTIKKGDEIVFFYDIHV